MWLTVTEVRSESFGLVTERRHDIGVLSAVTHIFACWTSPVFVTHAIFFVVDCGIARFLCAMRIFEVRPSSSSPRLPLCQISFCFTASIAELAHGEKSHTQSITHLPRLFDAAGTEAFASEKVKENKENRTNLTNDSINNINSNKQTSKPTERCDGIEVVGSC